MQPVNPKKTRLPQKQTENSQEEIKRIIDDFSESAFKLDPENDPLGRPIHGTTLYLATCSVELCYGEFTAIVFQDIIHKGYIIALAYGDIKNSAVLYSRIHSSCITSETLRGCDCDCVQQLEGALKKISENGNGILFYLMQEGRGVGYVPKARDRMLVQATHDGISTFQAYKTLGLKKDYRQYRNIRDICKLLDIKAQFILLTNNPDKVEAMKRQGLTVTSTETLEFEPGPFNLAYLQSKMESGHILEKPIDTRIKRLEPPEPVVPLTPKALEGAQRFIYAARYFLPVRPVAGEILLTEDEFHEYFDDRSIDRLIEQAHPLLKSYKILRNRRFLIKLHEKNLEKLHKSSPSDPLCNLLTKPYWFKVHVYFDTITGEDFVVLTYGKQEPFDVPVVRIHSESIFNRFPVKDMDNRDKFKASIQSIVKYGVGVILLLNNDGRGAGFGAHAIDKMLFENGMSDSTDESYRKLGVDYDSRDYDAAMTLMKHHLREPKVQMIMNSPSSLLKKMEWAEAINKHGIDVEKWIFLEKRKI